MIRSRKKIIDDFNRAKQNEDPGAMIEFGAELLKEDIQNAQNEIVTDFNMMSGNRKHILNKCASLKIYATVVETLLQGAVQENNLEVIKYLIPDNPAQFHIHPNTRLQNGNTALHNAIDWSRSSGESRLELIRYLIQHHADPNIDTEAGCTTLVLSNNSETSDVKNYLLGYHDGHEAAHLHE